TTAKMMPLYHTLKPLTLADADDVDKPLALENLDQHAVANFHRPIAVRSALHLEGNFAHELYRRKIVLRQVPLRRLGQPRLLHKFNQSDLGRLITISCRRL